MDRSKLEEASHAELIELVMQQDETFPTHSSVLKKLTLNAALLNIDRVSSFSYTSPLFPLTIIHPS